MFSKPMQHSGVLQVFIALDNINNSFEFQVQYQSDQFLDKNKDYVVPEHQDLLGASKCSFVAGLFPPIAEESSKSSKFSSIGSRFKVSLLLLLQRCW